MNRKKASQTFSVTTIHDGIVYEIKLNIETLRLDYGQTGVSQSVKCRCWAKEGTNAAVAQSCYWAVYLRNGTTYTYKTRNTTLSNAERTLTVSGISTAYQAIAVYALSTSPGTGNTAPTSYIAKAEIPIVVNGENAVRMDLSNQSDMVACDADGKVRFDRTVDVYAKIYDGATHVTGVNAFANPNDAISLAIQGATVSLNRIEDENGNPIDSSHTNRYQYHARWTFSKGTQINWVSAYVNIYLTYNNKTYSALLTLTRTDATGIYQLLPSKTEIKFTQSGGSYTPTSQELFCGYTFENGANTVVTAGPITTNTSKIGGLYYMFFRYINADGTPVSTYNAQAGIGNVAGWQWAHLTGGTGVKTGIITLPSSTTYSSVEYCLSTAGTVNQDIGEVANDGNIIDRECIPIVKDGESAKYIYARGTGFNNLASRIVYINSQTNQSENANVRGIEIITISRSTLEKGICRLFDTYKDDSARTNAANYLNGLDDTVFVCITSYDAIGWNNALIAALKNFGLGNLKYADNGRYPFAFLGYKGLQEGYALWKICGTGATEPYAEIGAYIADGVFMSSNDGENAVRLALDNEHEDFIYNDAGTLVSPSGGATSGIILYDGSAVSTSNVTEWRISANGGTNWGTSVGSNSGDTATASINTSTHVLTVSGLNADTAKVKVRALYNNVYYYAEFTANKTSQDKYELVLNPSGIAYNPDSYSTINIAFSATRTDLAGNKSSVSISTASSPSFPCLRLYAKLSSGSSASAVTTSPYSVTPEIASENTYIYFELRYYASSSSYRLCDYETVEIAKSENGATGKGVSSITKRFKANNSGDTAPSWNESTWPTDPAQAGWSASNRYLWCKERPEYDNGTSGSWGNAYVHSVWGQQGDSIKGDTGKLCYITGEYSASLTYRSDDSQTVAVEVTIENQDNPDLWGLEYSTNVFSGVHVSPDVNHPTPNATYTSTTVSYGGNLIWKKGLNQYNVVRTKYLFTDFASLGKFIVSGQWIYSQDGSIRLCNPTQINKVSVEPTLYNMTLLKEFETKSPGTHTLSFSVEKSVSNTVYIEVYKYNTDDYTWDRIEYTSITGTTKTGSIVLNNLDSGKDIRVYAYKVTSDSDIVSANISTPHDYLYFNTNDVAGSTPLHFSPQLALDGLAGSTYQKKGYIGGFTIGEKDLTNSDYDAGITIKNASSSPTQSVQIGADATDDMTGRKAAMVAEATETNTNPDDRPYNTALYLNAKNATYNYAFHGNGNGVLNGLIFGFKTNVYTVSGSGDTTTQLSITDGATIVFQGSKSSGIAYMKMPTLNNVKQALGLKTSTNNIPFAIELNLINHSSYDYVNICFYKTTSGYTDLPVWTSFNFSTSTDNLQLAKGDFIKVLLTYDGTNYRANVIIRKQEGFD